VQFDHTLSQDPLSSRRFLPGAMLSQELSPRAASLPGKKSNWPFQPQIGLFSYVGRMQRMQMQNNQHAVALIVLENCVASTGEFSRYNSYAVIDTRPKLPFGLLDSGFKYHYLSTFTSRRTNKILFYNAPTMCLTPFNTCIEWPNTCTPSAPIPQHL
jgi:hypothetical protein